MPKSLVVDVPDPPRHIMPFDLDDDGDHELFVIGGYEDGAYVLDLIDGEIVETHAFPGVVVNGLPLHLTDEQTWDLLLIHGESNTIEILPDAFG
jgi:hypothetical protein